MASDFQAADAALRVSATQAQNSTAVSLSVSSASPATTETIQVTVSAPDTAGGLIYLYENGVQTQFSPVAGGEATFLIPPQAAGCLNLTATYLPGDGQAATGSASGTVAIQPNAGSDTTQCSGTPASVTLQPGRVTPTPTRHGFGAPDALVVLLIAAVLTALIRRFGLRRLRRISGGAVPDRTTRAGSAARRTRNRPAIALMAAAAVISALSGVTGPWLSVRAAAPHDRTTPAWIPERETKGSRPAQPVLSSGVRARDAGLLKQREGDFEPNEGQAPDGAQFVASGGGATILLSPTGATVDLVRSKDVEHAPRAVIASTSIAFGLVGANAAARLAGRGEQPGVANYDIGSDQRRWLSGIRSYSEVVDPNAWRGIDVAWTTGGQAVEATLVVAPGANPAEFAMRVTGARGVHLNADGSLTIAVTGGVLIEEAPKAFQVQGGLSRAIPVRYLLAGDVVRLALGHYNPELPVTIDPSANYSSYVGGTSADYAYGLTVGSAGQVYITGTTDSASFGGATNPYNTDLVAYVAEVNSSGTGLTYVTFAGSSSTTFNEGVAITEDSSGNLWVAGSTGGGFPMVGTPYQGSLADEYGDFVAKFTASTGTLTASTFLSGTQTTSYGSGATAIAVDSAGGPVVVGETNDPNFPTYSSDPSGPIDGTFSGTDGGLFVATVTSMNSSLSGIIASTFLGVDNSSDDSPGTQAASVATDSSGNIYVGGSAAYGSFPLQSAFQTSGPSSIHYQRDFVSKMNAAESSLTFSTYLGGDESLYHSDTYGAALTLDSSGYVYVAGENIGGLSATHTLGTGTGAANYLIKLNSSGSTASYIDKIVGGSFISRIAVDGSDQVGLTGDLPASGFPFVRPWTIAGTSGNTNSAFVLLVDSTGAYVEYGDTLGGTDTSTTKIFGLGIDGSGNLYTAGSTTSSTFPTTNAGAYYGNTDAFVTKFVTSLVDGPLAPAERFGGDGSNCLPCSQKNNLHVQQVADPVDPYDGNFTESAVDFNIAGRGTGLNLTRTYNSLAASTNGAFGYGWASNALASLNCSGTTATVTEEGGSQESFTTTGSCSSGTWTPSAPRVIATLSYSSGTWTFVRFGVDTLTFNSSGELTAESDANGYTTSYTWTSGELTQITDSSSRSLYISYNSDTPVAHVSEACEGMTCSTCNLNPTTCDHASYSYTSGNLTSVTDVGGNTWDYTYDASHELTGMKDPACVAAGSSCNSGNGTVNVYTSGKVTSQTDDLGRQTTFSYSTVGPFTATTITDPAGNETYDLYGGDGLLLSQTRGYGTSSAATTSYGYDPNTGAVTVVVNQDGAATLSQVDASGNDLATVDALGNTTTRTFNSFNEPLTVTDAKGVTTTYTYTTDGEVSTVATPIGSSTQEMHYYYSSTYPSDMTSMQDANGHTWTYTYDSYGNLASKTDPDGNETSWTYNSLDWPLTQVAADGNVSGCGCASSYTTTYSYTIPGTGNTDWYGDVQTVTDPLGNVTTDGYDADRRLTSVKDGRGNTTTYVYDLDGELTEEQQPGSIDSYTSYNGDGTVATQTNGNGNVTSYQYDALARPVCSAQPPLSSTTEVTVVTYDAAGNPLTKASFAPSTTNVSTACGSTAPSSSVIDYAYDADNRLTSITYNDGGTTPSVSGISYDADGNRTAMTTGSQHAEAWTYDALDRLTAFTDGNNHETQYGYDLDNDVTTITYPGGTDVVTRGYDNADRWTSVQDWNSHTTSFSYDASGNLTGETLPTSGTSITDTNTYDHAGNLTGISDVQGATSVFSASYGYNANNNLSSDSSVPQNAYQSTALNQVCYAATTNTASCGSAPAGATQFAYDSAGNATTFEGATQTFNADSQLTASAAPLAAPTSYAYDSRGDLTSATAPSGQSLTLTTNQAGQMASASATTGIEQIANDVNTGFILRTDGTLWGWGYNSDGEIGNGTTTTETSPVEASISNVAQVAEAQNSTYAVKTDGTVWAWGNDANGQLGDGGTTNQTSPEHISGLTNIVSISSSDIAYTMTAAVRSDGTVWTWGDGPFTGDGTNSGASTPVEVCAPGQTSPCSSFFTGAKQVAVSGDNLYILKSDGTLWVVGYVGDGEIGDGSSTSGWEYVPVQADGTNSNVDQVVSSQRSVAIVTTSGAVYTWGANQFGQLGTNTTCSPLPCGTSTPTQVCSAGSCSSSLTGVTSLAASDWSYRAVVSAGSSGTIVDWGWNEYGDLGNNTTVTTGCDCDPMPGTVLGSGGTGTLTGVTYTETNYHTTWALTGTGTLETFGQQQNYDMLQSSNGYYLTPVSASGPSMVTTSATYTYDGNDLRLSKTVGTTTTNEVWDVTSSVPSLIQDGTTQYVDGPGGLPVEQVNGSAVLYYEHDRLGSTRVIVNSSGAVQATYAFDAYGNKLPLSSSNPGSVSNSLMYTGGYEDAETGFYYLHARYYTPWTGQFVRVDPLLATTKSPYGYVAGNPLNLTDPSGLSCSGRQVEGLSCSVDGWTAGDEGMSCPPPSPKQAPRSIPDSPQGYRNVIGPHYFPPDEVTRDYACIGGYEFEIVRIWNNGYLVSTQEIPTFEECGPGYQKPNPYGPPPPGWLLVVGAMALILVSTPSAVVDRGVYNP